MPRTEGFYLPGSVNAIDGVTANLLVYKSTDLTTVLHTIPFSVVNSRWVIDQSAAQVAGWPDDAQFQIAIGVGAAQRKKWVSINGVKSLVRAGTSSGPQFTSPDFSEVHTNSTIDFNWIWDRRIDIQVHSSDPGLIHAQGDMYDSEGLTETDSQWSTGYLPNGTYWIRITWPPVSNVWPDDPQENYDEGRVTTHQMTVSAAVSSSAVDACLGFSMANLLNSYTKPVFTEPTIAETFTSTSALQSKIDSLTDHGGAVYELAGGDHSVDSANSIRIRTQRNFKIYCDPNNRARLIGDATSLVDSSSFVNHLIDFNATAAVSDVEIINLELSKARFPLGIITNGGSVSGVHFKNIKIEEATFIGCLLRGPNVSSTTIRHMVIDKVATAAADGQGEGIYIGKGATGGTGNYADGVDIDGLFISNTFGEAVDMKRDSRNITLKNFVFKTISVKSQGAITLPLDDRGTGVDYDANITIQNGLIDGVTTREFNGDAISGGIGGTTIKNVVCTNIASGNVFDIYPHFEGPNDTISVDGCVLDGAVPIKMNTGGTHVGQNSPGVLTQTNNVGTASTTGYCNVNEADVDQLVASITTTQHLA